MLKQRGDLKVKYLTDTYKYVDEYPTCDCDIVMCLVSAIHSSKRTRKEWKPTDYVFSHSLFLDNFDERVLDDCIGSCLISRRDDLMYELSPRALSLVFDGYNS